MDEPSRTPRRRTRIPPVLAAACALLTAGCGADNERHAVATGSTTAQASASTSASTSAKAARPLTVQQLATAVGCTAKITSKAADYRQAQCTTDEANYVFLDFDTAEGQRAWLDYAQMYGGVYLVGNRWLLSAKSKEYMETLSAKLGGTVEALEAYGHSASPSGS